MFFTRNEAGSAANKETITSVIGQEMQMLGDISFKGKLRLDGKTEGNIQGDHLVLGETGMVIGEVAVNTLVCSGRVQGNVNVKKLQVTSSGVINGKVDAADLEVESGAALSGEIKSRSKELRLVPGSAIPQEEWDARVQEAAAGKAKSAGATGKPAPAKSSATK